MSSDRNNPEYQLLDWHLDRLEGEERSWIEQELNRDAQLRAKHEQLGRVLAPLDAWQAPAPPQLSDRVLSFVRRAKGDWDTSAPWEPTPQGARERAWPFFRLREIVAVAACLVLLVGVLIPGMSELRGRSQRAVCAGNLGSIFRGLTAYRADFGDSLPYAGAVHAAAWLPASDRAYASNSRHVFLLSKLNLVGNMSEFLCPADSAAEPLAAEGRASRADFSNTRNISYDTMNLAGASPNVAPPPRVAYMGDRNPLFVGGRFNDSVDPDRTNSPAHRGRGQSVLAVNGSAEFVPTPIFGAAHDNLWLMNGVRTYSGDETPTDHNDSFLVPGFPAGH